MLFVISSGTQSYHQPALFATFHSSFATHFCVICTYHRFVFIQILSVSLVIDIVSKISEVKHKLAEIQTRIYYFLLGWKRIYSNKRDECICLKTDNNEISSCNGKKQNIQIINPKEMAEIIYMINDEKYHFKSAFDTETGAYVRTGILDANGKDTGVDPFMASYPHLIDVGIMGHCIHGKTGLCAKAGIGCYQSGLIIEKPNMVLDDFRWIAEQCKGRCNQLALGGRGDPDQHENFEEILKICRQNFLIPNFTTSGYGITREIAALCKEYCGAVAVSWYRSDYTSKAIQLLLDAGVKTNIHYVLAKNSISEAIDRLKNNDFPKGINAVIFLLHKPVGLGKAENVLNIDDHRVREFFEQIDNRHPFKVGMDSCSVPGAVRFCKNVLPESLDTCEGGRYSCYISADMIMVPCSFDQEKQYEVSLHSMNIEAAWNSEPFERFRNKMRGACPECKNKALCMGGCPLMPEIVFCHYKERKPVQF